MTFLGGLRMKDPPNQALGSGWVPDGTFKRSRGLIAMIVALVLGGFVLGLAIALAQA